MMCLWAPLLTMACIGLSLFPATRAQNPLCRDSEAIQAILMAFDATSILFAAATPPPPPPSQAAAPPLARPSSTPAPEGGFPAKALELPEAAGGDDNPTKRRRKFKTGDGDRDGARDPTEAETTAAAGDRAALEKRFQKGAKGLLPKGGTRAA